jgi:hypothetical protein
MAIMPWGTTRVSAGLVLCLAACFPEAKDAPTNRPSELRSRAAFDLNCPESELRAVELGEKTRGVTGCGRRATYIFVCRRTLPSPYDNDCLWVLDSSTAQDSPAPASSAPATGKK